MEMINKFQFTKFVGVGIIGTLIDYSTFFVISLLTDKYLFATITGVIFGACVNFYLNKKFTFKNDDKRIIRQLLLYSITVSTYLLLTSGLMMLFVEMFGINKLISRVITIGVATPINYLLNKFIVYRTKQ